MLVKVSARTEYACIAMLELASSFGSGEPVRIRQIAAQHDIPSRFLVQILLQLKGAGLVASTRGAAGGYQLIKPPDEITLGDVMSVIEGPQNGAAPASGSPAAQTLHETWRHVEQMQQSMLSRVTLADLVERIGQHSQENMYYI